MTMSNPQRHDLHSGLEEFLGPQRAEMLMEQLPPIDWADVATKDDLDGLEGRLRADLTAEVASLHSKIDADVGSVHADMAVGFAELAGKIDVETANRRTDVEKVEKSMEKLLVAVLREQRIHLVVMVTVLSGLAAVISLFG